MDSLRDKRPVFRYRYLDEIPNTRIALYIFSRRRVRGAKDKKEDIGWRFQKKWFADSLSKILIHDKIDSRKEEEREKLEG